VIATCTEALTTPPLLEKEKKSESAGFDITPPVSEPETSGTAEAGPVDSSGRKPNPFVEPDRIARSS
jgi:hypothetical protein